MRKLCDDCFDELWGLLEERLSSPFDEPQKFFLQSLLNVYVGRVERLHTCSLCKAIEENRQAINGILKKI